MGESDRKRVLRERAEREAPLLVELSRLQQECDAADGEVTAAAEQLARAREKAFTLGQTKTSIAQALDRARSDSEIELRRIGEPRIRAFIDWLDVTRRSLRIEEFGGLSPRDPRTGSRHELRGSNADAVGRVAIAIAQARQRAEALLFEDVDLDPAIAVLRDSVTRAAAVEDVRISAPK